MGVRDLYSPLFFCLKMHSHGGGCLPAALQGALNYPAIAVLSQAAAESGLFLSLGILVARSQAVNIQRMDTKSETCVK
jgi:hypothetical protein